MPRKIRELRRDLARKGAVMVRQSGSHEQYRHPDFSGWHCTLMGKDSDDAKRYQEDEVAELQQLIPQHQQHP